MYTFKTMAKKIIEIGETNNGSMLENLTKADQKKIEELENKLKIAEKEIKDQRLEIDQLETDLSDSKRDAKKVAHEKSDNWFKKKENELIEKLEKSKKEYNTASILVTSLREEIDNYRSKATGKVIKIRIADFKEPTQELIDKYHLSNYRFDYNLDVLKSQLISTGQEEAITVCIIDGVPYPKKGFRRTQSFKDLYNNADRENSEIHLDYKDPETGKAVKITRQYKRSDFEFIKVIVEDPYKTLAESKISQLMENQKKSHTYFEFVLNCGSIHEDKSKDDSNFGYKDLANIIGTTQDVIKTAMRFYNLLMKNQLIRDYLIQVESKKFIGINKLKPKYKHTISASILNKIFNKRKIAGEDYNKSVHVHFSEEQLYKINFLHLFKENMDKDSVETLGAPVLEATEKRKVLSYISTFEKSAKQVADLEDKDVELFVNRIQNLIDDLKESRLK